MSAPKSLKDFKKASSNSNQNSILSGNKFQRAQQNISVDDIVSATNAAQQNDFYGGGQQDQGNFSQQYAPNFENAYQQAVETPVSDVFKTAQENYTNAYETPQTQESYATPQQVDTPIVATETKPIEQTQQVVQPTPLTEIPLKPEQTQQYTSVPTQQTPVIEKELKEQAYQNIPKSQVKKDKKQRGSIVSHMQEVEQEINGLVSNTEAFLNNTKLLKVKILKAKDYDELNKVMQEAKATLEDIPESFIDDETQRRIRVCFSYLQKEKKELLDAELALKKTQDDLQRLVSIDDIEELENAILEVSVNPATDSVYEIRTFEINLVNQLPVIKEEMLKNKMLAAYEN